jgi:hypothetical protein
MSKSDWLEVGLKLLGVYFLVAGTIALWRTVLTYLFASSRGAADPSLGAVALLLPLAELVAGFVLIRIQWHVSDSTQRHSRPIPGHLEESLRRMEQGGGQNPA